MGGRLVLDTSVVVDLFAGDSAVQRMLTSADEVFVPGIVLGKLFYGTQRSNRRHANLAKLKRLPLRPPSCPAIVPRHVVTAASRMRFARRAGHFPRMTSGSPLWHGSMPSRW